MIATTLVTPTLVTIAMVARPVVTIALVIATTRAIAIELIVLVIRIDIVAVRCRRAGLIACDRLAISGQTIRADGRGIKRGRQTLAYILHIDIGNR
jgi:hypothetical protein